VFQLPGWIRAIRPPPGNDLPAGLGARGSECGFAAYCKGGVIEAKRRDVFYPAGHQVSQRQRTNLPVVQTDGSNALIAAITIDRHRQARAKLVRPRAIERRAQHRNGWRKFRDDPIQLCFRMEVQ
jgi:hypothetical protein